VDCRRLPPGPPIVKASPNGEAFTICALVGVVERAGPTLAPSTACLCEGVSRVGRHIPLWTAKKIQRRKFSSRVLFRFGGLQ
jgi:hypothetical protein